MKTIFKISIIILVMTLASCKKEETPTPNKCNCGLVVSDDAADNSVVIRNSCSGNEKKFILSEGDWFNAYVGSDYCITNVNNW
jgi:hypothetical protein